MSRPEVFAGHHLLLPGVEVKGLTAALGAAALKFITFANCFEVRDSAANGKPLSREQINRPLPTGLQQGVRVGAAAPCPAAHANHPAPQSAARGGVAVPARCRRAAAGPLQPGGRCCVTPAWGRCTGQRGFAWQRRGRMLRERLSPRPRDKRFPLVCKELTC